MPNFYYTDDNGQFYWINLDHVCFVQQETDKLILKMSDGKQIAVVRQEEGLLEHFLISNTINWGYLFDCERPVDYGYDNSQSTDDDHLDIEPPTGVPFKPEDWEPKNSDLNDRTPVLFLDMRNF